MAKIQAHRSLKHAKTFKREKHNSLNKNTEFKYKMSI